MTVTESLSRLEHLSAAREQKLSELLHLVGAVICAAPEARPVTFSRESVALLRGALETYEAIEQARRIRTDELAETVATAPPPDRLHADRDDVARLAATLRLTLIEVQMVLDEAKLTDLHRDLLAARLRTGEALLDRMKSRDLEGLSRRLKSAIVAQEVARG